ncbi:hypothetical protein Slin15195_G103870 [Septoria linicola]|uniref:F-box domain-containing protein n=1 Tax=Septoria linicola TaxID=215465 RepID=A0A9Q9B196_9PEZI|nr:hypothetical protein Slin15195_G103870 [Septoria linicola]
MAAAADAAEAARSLEDRIQSLPQELQDLILEAAFMSFSSDTIVHVTRDYTLPAALQINKATRAKVAAAYYSSQKFDCSTLSLFEDFSSWLRWLASLDASHLPHLSHVRVLKPGMCKCGESECSLSAFGRLKTVLEEDELRAGLDVFRLRFRHPDRQQRQTWAWTTLAEFKAFTDGKEVKLDWS